MVVVWLCILLSSVVIANHRPHIVMIVMDDLGSHDLGMHGTGIFTPTIDDLAQAGIYLDNYYVTPYCSSTRAALLSGLYPQHTGVHSVILERSTAGLPLNVTTIADILGSEANYQTHAVGKWHCGHSRWEQTPTFRGFQSFFGFYQGSQDYLSHKSNGGYDFRFDSKPRCGNGCSQTVDERGNYSTHVFTREAIQVIEDFANYNNGTQPLFLYLAYQAVHCPDEVPDEYKSRYSNKINWTDQRKTYAGMLTAADEGIGNVTDALRRTGLWEDTLLVFTTDNGGPTITGCVQGSSNFPKRGGKHSLWEGGTKGDAFVGGPALEYILGHTVGMNRRFPHLFHVVDWLPTLAEVVGTIPKRNKNIDISLDGKSQLASFRDFERPAPRQELFVGYCLTGQWFGPAVRYQNWKIIQGSSAGPDQYDRNPQGSRQQQPGGLANATYLLFDLETDPLELNDISDKYPLVLQEMVFKLRQYQETFVPQQPNNDPSCPFTGPVNTTVGPTW